MLDKIDIQILNMLQEMGRTKRNVLAEAVGLSLPSLSERLKKLEGLSGISTPADETHKEMEELEKDFTQGEGV